MKYLILIAISLNISVAYANECSNLFMQRQILTEFEINTVIQDLHLLANRKYSSDKHVSQLSKSLFEEKYNDLALYIPREEIKKRMPITRRKMDTDYFHIENELRDILGTKVKVDNKKVSIYFENVNDLNRILEIMNIEIK